MKRQNQNRSQEQDTLVVTSTRMPSHNRQSSEHHIDNKQIASIQAAVELLESWQEGNEQEQRDTWAYLERALDEGRLSERSLLPSDRPSMLDF